MENDLEEMLRDVQSKLEDLTSNIQNLRDYQRSLKESIFLDFPCLHDSANELLQRHQAVQTQFQVISPLLKGITDKLQDIVKSWQRELQLVYAEMSDVTSRDIKTIASWCGQTSTLINTVMHDTLQMWEDILEEIEVPDVFYEQKQANKDLKQSFQTIFKDFVRSTFIVTVQGKGFHIKAGNKAFPKFSVRLLALENIPKDSELTMEAYFLSEDDINDCYHDGVLDINQIKKADRKLKSNTVSIPSDVDSSCHFESLQFAKPFKRKQDQKQVHEEKHRVVFVTRIDGEIYWTLSLPLVVITASNQEAHCLASIMWQCYSTNVFTLPVNIPDKLPWKSAEEKCVAEMLVIKMSRISTTHTLTEDNITHLKNRLFGREGVSDTAEVTLTMFCWSPMAGTDDEHPFPFWKWFLAIYNLIQKYLTSYWSDGLIIGFIKKEVAKYLLETQSDKVGTFILRFSDQYITPSDGVKNVFGILTSCVRVRPGKGCKRKLSNQNDSKKHETVESFEVANCEKLKNVVLANILREVWIRNRDRTIHRPLYCYHFPSNTKREDLFDKYCVESKPTINGYSTTADAGILCLEQDLQSMDLKDTSTHNSPIEPDNTQNQPDEKKHKVMKNDFPAISEILAGPAIHHSETNSNMHQSKSVMSVDQLQMHVGNPMPFHLDTIPTVVQSLSPTTTNSNVVEISCLPEIKSTSTESLPDDMDDIVQLITDHTRQCNTNFDNSLSENIQTSESSNLTMDNLIQLPYLDQENDQLQHGVPFGTLDCVNLASNNQETPEQEITLIVTSDPETSPNEQNVCNPLSLDNHLCALRPFLTEIQYKILWAWIHENTKNGVNVPMEEDKQ